MIARCREWPGQSAENRFAIVKHFTGLAVEYGLCADDPPAKRLAHCLVPQAHTKNWDLPGKSANQVNRNSRLFRRTRPGRNHDALEFALRNFIQRNLVVAAHFQLAPQLAQILRQVVSEGIVVVEE